MYLFESFDRYKNLVDKLKDEHCFIMVDSFDDAVFMENFLKKTLKLPLHSLTETGESINDWGFNDKYVYGFEISKDEEINEYTYTYKKISIGAANEFRKQNKHNYFYFFSDEFHNIIKPVLLDRFFTPPTYKPRNFIKENNSNKVLYAFDMDDTLVYSKRFEEHVKPLLVKEYLTPEIIFNNKIEDIGVEPELLKYENGRIYFDDPNKKYNIPKNSSWVRKKDRIYIIQPDSYFITDESMPIGIYPNILDIYNKAEYKCIITARKERIRVQTIKALQKLGIERPNMGLYMFPNNSFSYTWEYKANKLLELYNNYKYTEIHFFDDNIKLLKNIKKILKNKDINIKYYKVTKNNYREV